MLEKIPSAVGHALSGIRSGLEKITCYAELAAIPETIELESPMFGNGELIPRRFTADGQGLSPPLQWSSVPAPCCRFGYAGRGRRRTKSKADGPLHCRRHSAG